MLNFEEKKALIESMGDFELHEISMDRMNVHYPESKRDKKIIVKHLHPNGNAFIYAPFLEVEPLDKQGYVNVKDYSENEIRVLLEEAKEYMDKDEAGYKEGLTKIYQDKNGDRLSLVYENEMWVVYTGENLEAVFPTMEGAEGYLLDEGFFEA
ncbi:hypothetical protein [Listeria ivanovii]|uniref:DUF4241 domain-containing protein n=2 Tax=Listeria ivanovii TaxID=1638 RepID=A0ABS1G6K7_LISIV|nr:hypothetical protein [Listeria ivanovii]EFR96610.1 conserved hypothetical protein [Listeria ivanovii FSL F6-596]AIS60148.1 hypothetical protein JL58_09260 [Listeria ivanovii subsp. londoniensis]MBC2256217.1 hypothetical protein [Listeria ivanovii]MBK1962375.1 hypothetical protein [Listeria ivanovii subsp. londoniensis]MBK2003743.1 hypothetical protein [Listeria ivanovii subsp. londoniensis]